MTATVRDVWRVLRDGRARSATENVGAIGRGTTAAVTARVRDLRKPAFGSHVVVCERGADGVYRYRVVSRVAREQSAGA